MEFIIIFTAALVAISTIGLIAIAIADKTRLAERLMKIFWR